MPAVNTTWTVPWVESHCLFSSSPQCQRCCCIVPFSLSCFNLKVTDLNSAKQQWAPPSWYSAGPVVQSIHTSLDLGYLNSMKYIIDCMVYTPHGIYHLQVYTIGTSHLHPVILMISHLMPCYVPKKMIHTMQYTIQTGIYLEARIDQTCIYHGI